MRLKLCLFFLVTLGWSVGCRHKGSEADSSELAASASLKPACPLATSCTRGLPELSSPSGFDSDFNEKLATLGVFSHRARDVIAVEGQPVWIIGKFTYGYLDALLKGEEVDIYLAKSCQRSFEKIGTTKTTKEAEHVPIQGVTDDGARVFVELNSLGVKLPVGRHRLVLVVRADNSFTELFVDIIKPETKFIVSDIDGVLTSGEFASATEVHKKSPPAHAGAAQALFELYNKGYHILYLTTRPEWFTYRTRAWLNSNHFPPGTLRTTASVIGANGAAASRFKTAELALLKSETDVTPSLALGNKESDVRAFTDSGIPPLNSYYFNLTPDVVAGGNNLTDYLQAKKDFEARPTLCPAAE